MFPVARAVLLSMRASEGFGGVLKIVCSWASKTWLLPYACCGLHFIDSAACVLSYVPLLHYIKKREKEEKNETLQFKQSSRQSWHILGTN